MAITTNYSFNKPTVGGSEDTWGADLNTNWDSVDAILHGGTAIQPNLTVGSWQVGGISVTSTAAELNILDGVTATADQLNILDGVTATTAELNILDGVTATTAELNILDGVTATTAELNILDGVTATTAELNHLIGVTSEIQGQINSKANLSGASFTGAVDVDAALTANSFALDNGASDWTFEVSGNNLIVKYAGVSKMKLDTDGNLTVAGNVTAYGTV
jgi:hypothetical protein